MTQEQIQTYTLRVSQASPCELVVIMYDIILDDVKNARTAKNAGNEKQYQEDLSHAVKFVNELMGALDFSQTISFRLMSLYIYVNKMLVKARVSGRWDSLNDVELVIEKLRAGFDGIKDQDTSGPVMQNVQQVYAGLTYGKGTLNETYLNAQDYNRGFNA
ncbi:MAG: flagellar protein FliS [Lachnospiraceae bacterium]|nr:flagellar protein FliS [Lachnospiraceae bacterium]MBQ8633533.1 flagellar protein FliS [Lachnospiraceae bacterium]